ncbi:MAG: Nif11-like leader peptide family RiPP precursor [Oscillospiraceae bacterium]|nr:Nif11-like leader peptide family RiPP precursor [Oscillospiraceae bacterium]
MENLTEELITKGKAANSPEELLALAKENGIEFKEEQAEAYFDELHKTGELSDDELGNVAGGGCHKGDGRLVVTTNYKCGNWACRYCGQETTPLSHRCPNHEYGLMPSNSPGKCSTCKHMSYENGLWLCNHPANKK